MEWIHMNGVTVPWALGLSACVFHKSRATITTASKRAGPPSSCIVLALLALFLCCFSAVAGGDILLASASTIRRSTSVKFSSGGQAGIVIGTSGSDSNDDLGPGNTSVNKSLSQVVWNPNARIVDDVPVRSRDGKASSWLELNATLPNLQGGNVTQQFQMYLECLSAINVQGFLNNNNVSQQLITQWRQHGSENRHSGHAECADNEAEIIAVPICVPDDRSSFLCALWRVYGAALRAQIF
jgi:hypothetical protein